MIVKNEIGVYQIDGKDVSVGAPCLIIRNVWNRSKWVELEFEGKRVVVHERELIKAISNSTGNEVL